MTGLRYVLAVHRLAFCPWRCTAAADSQPTALAPVERSITLAERDHWAYRPLADVSVPKVAEGVWSTHPIDCFLKARNGRARGRAAAAR